MAWTALYSRLKNTCLTASASPSMTSVRRKRLDLHLHALDAELRGEKLHHLRHDGFQGEVREGELIVGGVMQQVAQQTVHALDLGLHARQELAALLLGEPSRAEELDVVQDDSQRVVDLVGHAGGEAPEGGHPLAGHQHALAFVKPFSASCPQGKPR